MRAADADWREHARRLADTIAAEGVLRDPAWRAALEAVPRHVFVPRFYTQRRPGGEPLETTAESEGWLGAVYRNEPLVTALAATSSGSRIPVSSSTKPGLMIRMLEALDLAYGHRVLEIGTGTGYNAALLAHRLGDRGVFSVDIGAELVADARKRLAGLGLAPTLVAAHGAEGLPGHAPFDRIIATCSVPAIPAAWAEQLTEGGLVLADVKRDPHAGNLAVLRRYADRLEGRFLPKWAGFMAIRDADTAPEHHHTVTVEIEAGSRSTTALDPSPWNATVQWLLTHPRLPGDLTFGYRNGGRWAFFTVCDGSWCAVRTEADQDGIREVRQSGRTAIWDEFTRAHQRWEDDGRPGWDRLGLTVLADGTHRVWLDRPDGDARWELP
ncbi:methyltransferase domain-containing protein [Pseudonocardia acaciae]|uniref:methyltransferase domain-containing protein n=1 Tax=Pseudonocardia acaciae TaxID=551276 RepID=UPI00048F83EE|nr:methyltransferase domain-containing protein [Pseudonocardia acaciae]